MAIENVSGLNRMPRPDELLGVYHQESDIDVRYAFTMTGDRARGGKKAQLASLLAKACELP